MIWYLLLVNVLFLLAVYSGEFREFALYIVLSILHFPATLFLEDYVDHFALARGWMIGSGRHLWTMHIASLLSNLFLIWVCYRLCKLVYQRLKFSKSSAFASKRN